MLWAGRRIRECGRKQVVVALGRSIEEYCADRLPGQFPALFGLPDLDLSALPYNQTRYPPGRAMNSPILRAKTQICSFAVRGELYLGSQSRRFCRNPTLASTTAKAPKLSTRRNIPRASSPISRSLETTPEDRTFTRANRSCCRISEPDHPNCAC